MNALNESSETKNGACLDCLLTLDFASGPILVDGVDVSTRCSISSSIVNFSRAGS